MAAHIFCKEEMQSPNATGIIFEVDARAWITCFETFGVIKLQQNQLQADLADLAELGSWDGGWSAGHFSNPGQGSDFRVQARPAARSPALAASLRWQPHAEGRILMEVWFNRWCLDWSRLWQVFQELEAEQEHIGNYWISFPQKRNAWLPEYNFWVGRAWTSTVLYINVYSGCLIWTLLCLEPL